jgi:hypothetical protein
MEGRPGERNDEFLVGETELEYCSELGANHYLISPNTKSKKPLDRVVHSGNCERLSGGEILEIIKSVPDV